MQHKGCVEVVAANDPGRWREVLDHIGTYDFYHLPAFHRLAEMRGEGEAVMFIYREADCTLAFPMLLREVDLPSGLALGAAFRDVTSVSGFAGPLASPMHIPEAIRQHFVQHLTDFLRQNRVLSVFSRLNPLMNQAALLEGHGETVERGVTVSIDLSPTPDEQFARYTKHLRKEIRQLRRSGLSCELVGHEYLDTFVDIYRETMRRTDAEAFYYFDQPYFECLMSDMPDVMRLFVCRNGDTVMSAALCAICGDIIEIYLSGTRSEFLSVSPSKLLHDDIRIWGNEVGAKVIHMGGGREAKRDSLYNFKMALGGREHVYFTWRYIVDQNVYDDVCREMFRRAGFEPNECYFPAYRHPGLRVER